MRSDDISLLVQLGIPVALLIVTYFSGRIVISRHLARLDAGERETAGVLTTGLRSFPGGARASKPAALVVAEAVVSVDYFRSWVAKFFNIIGGEVTVLTGAASRARREALLRLRREAVAMGHDAICNLRVETCNIRGAENPRKRAGAVVVVVLASATAYTRDAAVA